MADNCNTPTNDISFVIKSVNYFISDILQSSKSDGDWTIDCVKRGIGWASYCEEVARQPNIASLLSIYLEKNELVKSFNLTDIKNFRKYLISNLMMNQLLPRETYEYVEKVSEELFGKDEALKMKNNNLKRIESYEEVIREIRLMPDIYNSFKIFLLLETKCYNSKINNPLSQLLEMPMTLKKILNMVFEASSKEKDHYLCCIGEWLLKEFEKESMWVHLLKQFSNLSENEIKLLLNSFPGLSTQLLILIKTVGNSLYINTKSISDCDQVYSSVINLVNVLLKLPFLTLEIQEFFVNCFKDEQAHFWIDILKNARQDMSQ